MKTFTALTFLLSFLICDSKVYAQPKYKYRKTSQFVKNFRPKNTYTTPDGFLLLGKRGFPFSKEYLINIDDNMKIVDKRKIPKKVNGQKLLPLGLYKMGNNYVAFYQYYKKKKLYFGYDLYHPSGGYFDGNFRELTSKRVKRRRRDYYEPYVYENEESGNSMLVLNHKNIKIRYYVIAAKVETKDVKQEMFLFDDRMKTIQHDKRFKLRGTEDDELRGTYELTDFEIDANNNIFILGSKKPKEAKGRKARKKRKKNMQKTELGLFLRSSDGDMSGQPIPLAVEVKSIDLAKNDEQITSMGTYITDPEMRFGNRSEGLFRVNLYFDEDLEEVVMSDPEYFPYSKEFAEAFSKNYDLKEKKSKKKRSRPEPKKKKKKNRLVNLENGNSQETINATGENYTVASVTDIKFMDDGSTIAILEEQYLIIVATTTTNSSGGSSTSYDYLYHYNNLGIMKIDPEGEMTYAILPKQTVMVNNKKEKGYEAFEYDNSLVILQEGEIHEVDLEDMSIKSNDIKQWKVREVRGISSHYTDKDGYNFFILNNHRGLFKKSNLLEVISLTPPR